MAEMQQTVAELNDLVRGHTEGSQKAIEELKAGWAEHDEQVKLIEQLRADVDKAFEDIRAFSERIISRTTAADGSYKGNFESRDQAKLFGLAVAGICCGKSFAIEELEKSYPEELKSMTTGSDSAGGFLTTEGMMQSVLRLVAMYGVFRRDALTVPMGDGTVKWPKRTGGLTVYCPGEGTAPTASDVTLGLVNLVAQEWLTLTYVSQALAEDSIVAIAELIADEIALAFAAKEDACGFVGDGTATYFGNTGVMEHDDINQLSCSSGDTTFADACGWEYIAGAVGQVYSPILARAKYFMHRTVLWQLVMGQTDSSGNPIVKFGVPGAAVAGGGTVQPTILGYPVEVVESLPDTDDSAVSTDAWMFGSLYHACVLGQRGGIQVARSDDYKFAEGLTTLRGKERIAVRTVMGDAMVKVTTAAS
jgi:HK97 family phage major capsid protein